MCEKKENRFQKFTDQRGFTLIELTIVCLIIITLSAMGMLYFRGLREKAGDNQAFAEGRGLLTAANDAFLSNEDVDFTTPLVGTTGPLGTITFSDSSPRPPVFKVSKDVRARIQGFSTPAHGGGWIIAKVWHIGGSDDPDPLLSPSGKKEYYYEINEGAGVISYPESYR